MSHNEAFEFRVDGAEFIGVGIQSDVVVEEAQSIIFGKENVIEETLRLLSQSNNKEALAAMSGLSYDKYDILILRGVEDRK